MTRVLHVINGEHYAGAERVQDLLALRLPEWGYEVGFACLKAGQFSALRQSQDCHLVELPMRGRFDVRPAWLLASLLRREGYQLVHSHTARSALVGGLAARLAGVGLVHHLHSPTARDTTHRWQNRINVALERLLLRRASAIVAVSNSLRQYAEQAGLPADRLHVVHNGVPTRAPLDNRPAPREAWTIGCVALFRPRKGLEVLLDALAQLRRQGFDVRLRAIGGFETADYQREILDRVQRLAIAEAITWRGFQRDVYAELAALDAFVLPSLFGEGLPMVVLEAMASGVPVVATRVEGVPEVLRDGVDGLLAEAGNAADLASMLQRLLRGEANWDNLRTSAHQRQAEGFSDASMAAGVAAVYDQVLGRNRRTLDDPTDFSQVHAEPLSV